MKSALIAACAVLALWGCGNTSDSEGAKSGEIDNTSGVEGAGAFEEVRISQDGFELEIAIPNDYREGNSLDVEFDSSFGHMIVKCGPVFEIVITQEEGSFQNLLEELESDMVFKYQLYDETRPGALYRQYIPNTDQEFWHFFFTFQHKGEHYVIKDAPMSELNEYQSRKIYNALSWATRKISGQEGAA